MARLFSSLAAVLVLAALTFAEPAAAAPSFTGLGFLSSGSILASTATGVSADGAVVVGSSDFTSGDEHSSEAFLWTAASGMRSLKDVLTDDYGLALGA